MDAVSKTIPNTRVWTRCPVCAATDAVPYVMFDEVGFVQCVACTTVYKLFELAALRPDDFYEHDYFHGRRSGRDRRFEHRVRKAMRWIRSTFTFGPVHRILDVGCSFGYVVEAGRRLGLSSAGVDVSSYAVEVCRRRGLEVFFGSLDAQPFPDGHFDLVLARHVLEHTPQPAVALREIRRVLTAEGLLLLAVPNLTYWKGLVRRRTGRYFRPDDLGCQHYVYYTRRTIRRLLEAHGFEVLVTTKAFFRDAAASQSSARWILEWIRLCALRAGLGLAALLFLQREVFVIARRAPERRAT
jgi:SAM-dependent methyltransferase